MSSAVQPRVLLTGGSGVLGRELLPMLADASAPPSTRLDVRDAAVVSTVVREMRPRVIVHAAAYTDVAAAERERGACWLVNVAGTRSVVAAAREVGARLVLISTDYVFYGGPRSGGPPDRGPDGYREDDPPGPVRNYYALSKLAAEEVARTLAGTLVIRTSFRPRSWPHPVAFDDLYTSQDYVDVVAPDIALAVNALDQIGVDTLHIATERKSAYELASRRRPDVRRGSRRDAAVDLPDDITLDIGRWRELRPRLAR